jgi:hypothetical protein
VINLLNLFEICGLEHDAAMTVLKTVWTGHIYVRVRAFSGSGFPIKTGGVGDKPCSQPILGVEHIIYPC